MSISIQTLKYIKSLHLRKFRQKYNNFLAEGDKIVSEMLQQSPAAIENIYALSEWMIKNKSRIAPIQDKVHPISEEELKKISTLVTPNQVLAIVKQPIITIESTVVEHDLSLYLDGIQDPGNMGTILRIADWFAIKHVFCAPNCVEVFSPKVVQASMGAFLRIHCVTYDIMDLKNQFPALPIYGAALNGVNIFETKLNKAGILVIGNESKGISAETEAFVNQQLAIPSMPGGGAESLNAAVATGIIVAVLRNA